MLAHFGALAGVRAALLHQLEAGQQRLAQGRARLQRYHEEAGGELLRGRDEVLQLRARLEAARHDVLQGVRAAVGPLGPPPGGEGLAYRPLIVTPLVWRADAPWGGDGEGAQGQECWEVQGTWGPGLSVCLSAPQESCWTQIQSAATHKTLLLGQIRMAVLSLFQLATKHLKVPRDVALEDTETQLDVVSLFPIKIQPSCGAAAPASFRAAAWGGITPVTSCPQEAPRGGRIQNQPAI
uniref:Uncharacterized protein n=1 Tax=Anser brachyrhynchus TaxID=132585 RepID=A0A8B9CLW8_9AVES